MVNWIDLGETGSVNSGKRKIGKGSGTDIPTFIMSRRIFQIAAMRGNP